MNHTPEQLAIFDEVANPTAPVLSIKATAGSGKSSTLVESIDRISDQNQSITYLVFGQMAAAEAKLNFGNNAYVATFNAFAYRAVVKQCGLSTNIAPFLTWRDIPKSIRRPFGTDFDILQLIEGFCKSPYLSMDDYVANDTENVHYSIIQPAKLMFKHMQSGKSRITHSFYTKIFHILLMQDKLTIAPIDKLLVDEFQDMTELAVQVLQKLPAKQKVFVGDSCQAVFNFLGLVDGFEFFPDAKTLHLTKSFRVHKLFAPAIQYFLRKHLEPDAQFIGMDYPTDYPDDGSTAYLCRTNMSIINHMIKCDEQGKPYSLGHDAKLAQMFKLPLALIYAKPGFVQRDPDLKHIQADIDDWAKLPEHVRQSTSKLGYILEANPDDARIKQAATLIGSVGPEAIVATYQSAESHKQSNCNYQILSCHNSKGMTTLHTILDDDVDAAIEDLLDKPRDLLEPEEIAELNLYFVACTRHRLSITNAKYLDELMGVTND